MRKERIDLLLVSRGLVESRAQAQKLVMAGEVRVDGQVVMKPADRFQETVNISIHQKPRFVSRGGEKLESALLAFGLVNLEGRICVDVGASTGGFTDCLLQHGAKKVYAVDVGFGELHWKLRSDARVVVMEKTNARFLNGFPEPIDLVVVDASFISLKILLPVITTWLQEKGDIVTLIKPQFEAGRADVSRGEGVIHDPAIHRRVLLDVLEFAVSINLGVQGLIVSPIKGPKGNTEFLAYFFCSNRKHPLNYALIDQVSGSQVPFDGVPGDTQG